MINPQTSIAICLSSDNNYIQHLATTMASILTNANKEFIKFYIITDGFSKENKLKLNKLIKIHPSSINYIKPNKQYFEKFPSTSNSWLSIATYYRLFIPEMIPEDKVIYLDCDIIVRDSLLALYNKEFTNNTLFLGVKDISANSDCKRLNISKYLNAGVLLFNNKQLREEQHIIKMFDCLNKNRDKIRKHDQDIINLSSNNRIDYIEDEWNCQVFIKNESPFEKIKNPKILHFISPKKPWTLWKPISTTKWHSEYFKYLRLTEWKDFEKQYKINTFFIYPLRIFYPTGLIKTLLNNIFSIKNSKDKKYKIITILGIKINKKKQK